MKSIVEQIFHHASSNGEKIALTDGKASLTYAELVSSTLHARELLSDKYGVSAGDRVILAADKQVEFAPAYLACHLLGATTLPIAPDTNPNRYDLIKSKSTPSLVIGFSEQDSSTRKAELNEFRGSVSALHNDSFSFPILDDIADIIFTTGTTGEPKGVQLSQRNIAAAARNINSFVANSEDDVEMLALPISHSFGLGRMRCALSNGQTLVLQGGFANVKRFFRFIEDYGVNGFGMVPASWALLKRLSGNKIGEYADQIHYIEIGSAPMPLEEKETLIELLPHTRICMHYGLTEASRSSFIEFHSEQSHLDTVGKPTPGMTITIRDEQGVVLPAGARGEICVSGDAVTVGYLGIPNESSFWGDSFRTGDCGYATDNGYITLVGREKEMINVGGKKVSPIEVENVLQEFDFVEDCVCISAPDPSGILGEVVKACIVTSDPSKIDKETIDTMIGSRLEGYKHPAIYQLIDEVPKTSSGKIQRLSLA